MKRLTLLLIITTIVLSAFLFSCNENSEYYSTDDIVGCWSCKYGEEIATLTFNKDNTGTIVLTPRKGNSAINFEYSITENVIKINSTSGFNAEYIIKIKDRFLFIKKNGSEKEGYKFIRSR